MASSGLAYPERFYAAAAYVGFGGSPNTSSPGAITRFANDVALLLYGLYQQATAGPCNAPKPRTWNAVEHGKWTSWDGLGNMASTEAMRLFVKILEEEDPGWYSRIAEFVVDPVADMELNRPELDVVATHGNSHPEPVTLSTGNDDILKTHDKDITLEGLGTVNVYDQWITPSVSGQRPKSRCQHGAAVVQEKMYVFGGNHNGHYLRDLQVLDLKNLTWSKIEAKTVGAGSTLSSTTNLVPCAGHSLVSWGDKILSIAGHTRHPSEIVTVKEFDPQTYTWSDLKTYGKAPVSRGGQSVTLVGTSLVMLGGEDAKRNLFNDLHILDLETMTWNEIDAGGLPPAPRSDHTAAAHVERYLLIFGGRSHSTCFNDLHILDLQNMEWLRPKQQGVVPAPRASHAGITTGENWFIVGGGDGKNGVSETLVLNMSTLFWSVVTSVQGRVPVASEGLSLVVSSKMGEDILVSFGGYNGWYNNEVNVLKPSHKSQMIERPMAGSVASLLPTEDACRDVEPEFGTDQSGKIGEIVMENVISDPVDIKSEEMGKLLVTTLKAEKEELETALSKEKLQTHQLKLQLSEAESRNTDLTKELQSVRGQLASEQSRCFKLEVDVAELRQKLQTMEILQKEVELVQRQKAALELAALNAKQRQGSGVWGWLAGTPPDKSSS